MTQASRYTIRPFKDGFEIRGKDRNPARVTYDVDNMYWQILWTRKDHWKRGPEWHRSRIDDETSAELHTGVWPYDAYNLANYLGEIVLHDWKQKGKPFLEDGTPDKSYWFGCRQWAQERAARALYGRVKEQMDRVMYKHYPPLYMCALKRVFAHTFRHAASSQAHDLLLGGRHLWQDAIKYRACAHALKFWHNDWVPMLDSNWMQAYATGGFNGEVNRSARRTIMNLPHAMANTLVERMQLFVLERPLTDRVLLSWACAFFMATGREFGMHIGEYDAFKYAAREDLERAARTWDKYIGAVPGTSRVTRSNILIEIAHFIRDGDRMDYRVLQSHTVNAALKRAIDAHSHMIHNYDFGDYWNTGIVYDSGKEVAQPPIPLPEEEGITFLATVGDIRAEGRQMHHCISGYANDAVDGKVYIFHIEHDGETASASVSIDGRFIQCLGPCNMHNSASQFGRSILAEWASELLESSRLIWDDNGTVLNRGTAVLPLLHQFNERLP